MFLLNIIPAAIIHTLLLADIAGFVLTTFFSMIPFIGSYLKQIQIAAVAVLVVAVWLEGGLAEKKSFDAKTAAVELKVSKKETAAAEVTTQIVTKYVDRIKTIKEKGETIYVKIPEIITKYDSTCQLPNAFTVLYDSSITGEIPAAIRTTDANSGTTSDTTIGKQTTTK